MQENYEQTIQVQPEMDSAPKMETKYVSFGKRLLAYFIDFGIISILGNLVQNMFGQNSISMMLRVESLEELQQLQAASNSSLPTLISIILAVAYYMIFLVNYDGATPGKRVMAIKITKESGEKLTYPVVFIRYLGMFISSISFGLGFLWILWDKKKQSWHDKIAKTIVVETGLKPKTGLAIFISIISILFMVGYASIGAYIGYTLGMDEVNQKTIDSQPAISLKQNQEAMSPEAKVHFDKSQELFVNIRENRDDLEKIKPLANEAITELETAVEIDPENPVLWSWLGSAYTWPNDLGKTLEDSLEAAMKAEELDPTNVVYINNVGDFLLSLGKNEDAVIQFNKSLRLTDSSGYAHSSIGIAYRNLGINDSAAEHFQKAIDIFTKNNADGNYDTQILQIQKLLASLPK